MLATPTYRIRKDKKAGFLVSPKDVKVISTVDSEPTFQSPFGAVAQVPAQPPSEIPPIASSSSAPQPSYVTAEQFTTLSDKWAEQFARILFIYLGFLRRFQHCTGHITTGSWKGRGNQYIEFARVVYCKLPTNGKQLPALPLTAMTGIEPRPQRWEARVLPLCHRGPHLPVWKHCYLGEIFSQLRFPQLNLWTHSR